MIQELADESENQGLKMNKSKTKVMMETDISVYMTQTENVERDMGRETQIKTSRSKESRPDGQHSPNTATSSRVPLQQA